MKPDPTRGAQANNVVLPSPEAISRAVELLREGRLVGMPTETVYGLAGDGLNPAALARIFEVKQRPLFDPLILHFADAAGAFALAEQIPIAARASAKWRMSGSYNGRRLISKMRASATGLNPSPARP